MTMPKTILVPTDFSETAEPAVAYAFELAERLHASVHLLHAYDVPAFPDGMALGADVLTPITQAAERAMQIEAEKYRGHPQLASARSQMGEPSDLIARVARELPADLIVIGSHGRRGFRRLVLGSVAEAVLRAASCPVLIVQHPDSPTAERTV